MYTDPYSIFKPKPSPLPDAEYNQVWPEETYLKQVKRYNDPRFGEVILFKDTGNEQQILKEKLTSSKADASQEIAYLKSRQNLNNTNIMRLGGYSTTTTSNLCSTSYLVKAFYEIPQTDLLKEIADREKNGNDFDDSELTHLAYQILNGLGFIHDMGYAHGDIRPQLIGFNRQKMYFDISDRLLDASPIERCQANNIATKKDLYVSPELYKKLKGKNKQQSFNPCKNDVFALGLTILYAGVSASVQDIYLPDGEIEHRKLQEHVMNFDAKHAEKNPLLSALIKTLLQMDENTRKDVSTILKEIISYEDYKRSDKKTRSAEITNRRLQNAPPSDNPKKLIANISAKNGIQLEKKTVPEKDNQNYYNNSYMNKTNNLNKTSTMTKTTNEMTAKPAYRDMSPKPNNYMISLAPNKPQLQPEVQNVNYYGDSNNLSGQQYLPTTKFYPKSLSREPVHHSMVDSQPVYYNDFTNRQQRNFVQTSPQLNVNNPILSQTQPGPVVIKKRYVMRDDGTVVEIDPNQDFSPQDIQKYFNNNYNERTIAHFGDINDVLGCGRNS